VISYASPTLCQLKNITKIPSNFAHDLISNHNIFPIKELYIVSSFGIEHYLLLEIFPINSQSLSYSHYGIKMPLLFILLGDHVKNMRIYIKDTSM
jgi:hypothetical protein